MSTPGQWRVVDEIGAYAGVEVHAHYTSADGADVMQTIADVIDTGDDTETLANARLIAAAPDLLTMLRLAKGMLDMLMPGSCMCIAGALCNLHQIDAVIAKAEGK
jgi:hypothetical protein